MEHVISNSYTCIWSKVWSVSQLCTSGIWSWHDTKLLHTILRLQSHLYQYSNSSYAARWFAPLLHFWYSVFEITSQPIWDPSALANSPFDHFSRRRRYHQCPDWDQTFSKGSFTSLLKLSNKSTFNVRARRTKLSFYCRIQGILWFLLFFHTFFTNFFESVFLKVYFSEVYFVITPIYALYIVTS